MTGVASNDLTESVAPTERPPAPIADDAKVFLLADPLRQIDAYDGRAPPKRLHHPRARGAEAAAGVAGAERGPVEVGAARPRPLRRAALGDGRARGPRVVHGRVAPGLVGERRAPRRAGGQVSRRVGHGRPLHQGLPDGRRGQQPHVRQHDRRVAGGGQGRALPALVEPGAVVEFDLRQRGGLPRPAPRAPRQLGRLLGRAGFEATPDVGRPAIAPSPSRNGGNDHTVQDWPRFQRYVSLRRFHGDGGDRVLLPVGSTPRSPGLRPGGAARARPQAGRERRQPRPPSAFGQHDERQARRRRPCDVGPHLRGQRDGLRRQDDPGNTSTARSTSASPTRDAASVNYDITAWT